MMSCSYDDKAVQGGSLYVRRGGAAINSINIVSAAVELSRGGDSELVPNEKCPSACLHVGCSNR